MKAAKTEFLKIRICIDCTVAFATIVVIDNCPSCYEPFLEKEIVECDDSKSHYHTECAGNLQEKINNVF